MMMGNGRWKQNFAKCDVAYILMHITVQHLFKWLNVQCRFVCTNLWKAMHEGAHTTIMPDYLSNQTNTI